MRKALFLFLIVVSLPAVADARARAVPPASKPLRAPVTSVADVLARTRPDDGPMLRDLIDAPVAVASGYAARRAALRACHAGRYATARDNVLSGRTSPLRDC